MPGFWGVIDMEHMYYTANGWPEYVLKFNEDNYAEAVLESPYRPERTSMVL